MKNEGQTVLSKLTHDNRLGQWLVAVLMSAIFLSLTSPGFSVKELFLQATIAVEILVLTMMVWNWHELVGAYMLSFRYRRVLPYGNVFRQAVHVLLEEAVCGSSLTSFLSQVIPTALQIGLPALTAWFFGFGSLAWLSGLAAVACVAASLIHALVYEHFGWSYYRRLPLFKGVQIPEDKA